MSVGSKFESLVPDIRYIAELFNFYGYGYGKFRFGDIFGKHNLYAAFRRSVFRVVPFQYAL